MRGGALPPAILFAALGFALSFAPRRALLPAILLAVAMAAAVGWAHVPPAWREIVFAGCWASAALTAATVHLPRGLPRGWALAVAGNAGVWAGAVVAVAGAEADIAKAAPLVLLCIPGQWLVRTSRGIVLKVAASWLIAVSVLAGTLPMVPTPGYAPDHME